MRFSAISDGCQMLRCVLGEILTIKTRDACAHDVRGGAHVCAYVCARARMTPPTKKNDPLKKERPPFIFCPELKKD
jgi:hypothetical protein